MAKLSPKHKPSYNMGSLCLFILRPLGLYSMQIFPQVNYMPTITIILESSLSHTKASWDNSVIVVYISLSK